ncbi:carbohydrate ABC transporter permease [Cellulomonas sp. ATA003]|uniref:carbohydrate ABC transporter permease n=1 Tax=Cellulomonas sp. ATA003 TaxID=3073064 RepID=UPI0028732D52|nr:carbohydrate ABC transporter permease [Cellulomonas sp. ATA003]WNB87322.1 carbohydrate ABC transporter permease [Cellulomonas sp. ATA003]
MLCLCALVVLIPFIWMVSTALKPSSEVFANPPSLIGSTVEWENFAAAWNYLPFGRFMLNGVIVAGIGTIIVVLSSAMAAYAFSRLRWRGRDGVFLIYLGTLMIPQEVLVVPMFILMRELGWVNSYAALIVPWAFTAFGTFLLRQFFLTVPDELEEAARLDGANRFVIFVRIVLPLAKPAMGTLAVFTFIGYWNSFLWPLLIISDVNMATVPLGLNMFMGQTGNQWNLLMAASAISILPSLLIVIALQRYLVSGIALSGMGGR